MTQKDPSPAVFDVDGLYAMLQNDLQPILVLWCLTANRGIQMTQKDSSPAVFDGQKYSLQMTNKDPSPAVFDGLNAMLQNDLHAS